MPQAAIPAIGAGIGAIGNAFGAHAAKPKNVAAPPPNALFPGQQTAYLSELSQSGLGSASFGTLAETAKTGLPTDQTPFFDALKSSMAKGVDEGRASLIEKFGSKGLRNSSDLLKAGSDYEEQTQKDFATILADYTRQAGEAAANRRVAASTAGIGIAGEPGLAETPSSNLVTGSPSTVGSSIFGGLQGLLVMKNLYPDLFANASP
jgi:hypothetical protein